MDEGFVMYLIGYAVGIFTGYVITMLTLSMVGVL